MSHRHHHYRHYRDRSPLFTLFLILLVLAGMALAGLRQQGWRLHPYKVDPPVPMCSDGACG